VSRRTSIKLLLTQRALSDVQSILDFSVEQW
jgi:hypothetical protein